MENITVISRKNLIFIVGYQFWSLKQVLVWGVQGYGEWELMIHERLFFPKVLQEG